MLESSSNHKTLRDARVFLCPQDLKGCSSLPPITRLYGCLSLFQPGDLTDARVFSNQETLRMLESFPTRDARVFLRPQDLKGCLSLPPTMRLRGARVFLRPQDLKGCLSLPPTMRLRDARVFLQPGDLKGCSSLPPTRIP